MDFMKLMQAWFPTWTDQERHDVLWNCTAYPVGGTEYVTEQLRELRVTAIRGATPDELIAEAEQELAAAMEERE